MAVNARLPEATLLYKAKRPSLLQRLRDRFVRRRMSQYPQEFVMTTFQDKLIVADNRDRNIYELVRDFDTDGWNIRLIATF